MTRDIDDLKNALKAATPKPDTEKKTHNRDLAMAAFDAQFEDKRAPSPTQKSLLERFFRPSFLMPGGLVAASVAALLLVVNVDDLTPPPETSLSTPETADFSISEPAAKADPVEQRAREAEPEVMMELADDMSEEIAAAPPAPADTGVGALSRSIAPSEDAGALQIAPQARMAESPANVSEPPTILLHGETIEAEIDGAETDIRLRVAGSVIFPATISLTQTSCSETAPCPSQEILVERADARSLILVPDAVSCGGETEGFVSSYNIVLTDAAGAQSEPIEVEVTCVE